jgi:hypothetical protein
MHGGALVLLHAGNDDLTPLARCLRAAQSGSDPVIPVFLASTVHVERDEFGDGMLIHERADHSRWVHAYTGLDLVPGVAVGHDVDVATMTGQHLLSLLPPEVGVRLDEGHHQRDVALPSADPARPAADSSPGSRPTTLPRLGEAGALGRAVRAAYLGQGDRARVVEALRETCVFVGRQADAIPVARLPERGNWLCVFSSGLLLRTQLGGDSRSMMVAGGDLLDVLVPALSSTVGALGVFLDMGTDHGISLPAPLLAYYRLGSVPTGSVDGGGR